MTINPKMRKFVVTSDDSKEVFVDLTSTDVNFKPCRKLPLIVGAVQINEPFIVETLEGLHTGSPGDYLMVGVNNERYPCKKEIFEKSYEWV